MTYHALPTRSLPRLTTAALATVLAGSLPACSGGGGSGGGPGGGGGPSGQRYHMFLDGLPGSGTMNLVDPGSPSNPVVVDGSLGVTYEFNPVFSGTLDAAAQTLRDLQVDRLIFADGNRLLSLSVRLGQGSPALQEIYDFGAPVDDLTAGRDLSGAGDTLHFVVEVGGAGSYQALSQTGANVTTPVPFPGAPVTFVGSPTDGSFQGWVGLESGMLTRVAPDLSVTNLTATADATLIDVTNGRDAFFTLSNGFGVLRSNDTYVDVSFTPVAAGTFTPDEFTVVGETAMYFASPTGPGSFEIVRALPDGTASAITGSLMGEPSFLNVTPTRLLCGFEEAGGAGESLVSYDLLGGDEQSLESGAASIEYGTYVSPGIEGDRIVYTVPGTGVVDVASDGSERQLMPNATVAGATLAPTLSFGNALTVDSIILTSPAPTGGLSLTSMTPGDPASQVALGIVPPGSTNVAAAGLFTSSLIITVLDATQSDIFVATRGSANSLRRVTDTPARFEVGAL